MKIEDVREICKEKNIPNHIIEKFIAEEVELTETDDVKEPFFVIWRINEIASNVEGIRLALKATSEMRKRRKTNGK